MSFQSYIVIWCLFPIAFMHLSCCMSKSLRRYAALICLTTDPAEEVSPLVVHLGYCQWLQNVVRRCLSLDNALQQSIRTNQTTKDRRRHFSLNAGLQESRTQLNTSNFDSLFQVMTNWYLLMSNIKYITSDVRYDVERAFDIPIAEQNLGQILIRILYLIVSLNICKLSVQQSYNQGSSGRGLRGTSPWSSLYKGVVSPVSSWNLGHD